MLEGGIWSGGRIVLPGQGLDHPGQFCLRFLTVSGQRLLLAAQHVEPIFLVLQLFHVALEQLFFLRPLPGWAKYQTPIENLWMCGSATHPGGGVMGAPGRNAARRILGLNR